MTAGRHASCLNLAVKETGEKRTKNVVVVDNRFGEVGVSLRYVSARIERAERAAAQAG